MPDHRFTSRLPVAPSRVAVHIAVAVALFAAAVLLTGCGA